ncbi:glycosyltransferase [Erythrobacter sp. NE805]|uniref:glycosyltransferase n=1 Tax=Erythrobacter sp. NE805 TaxID=3389875 RepID=UPI00396B303A
MTTTTSTIAYLVHDLGDAAVARRIEGLSAGGARVALAGFYRRAAPASVAGAPALAMGRSHDARLARRAGLVLRRLVAPGRARALVRRADIVVARNLEMLVIAARLARPGQSLVYECLDIHRKLLGTGLVSRALRWLERRLLARTARVIVSSPAFERDYFRGLQNYAGPVDLIENKVSALPEAPAASPAPPESGPWTIGWFGMLRCRRSLAILARLAARSQGRIRVLVAGIPSPDIFPDLPAEISKLPHVEYAGPYRPADLPRLYGRVHFAWCIDYFEEGLNSAWLLPNRLYESLAHGVVPVALAGVETGRWLEAAGVGLRLAEGEALGAALERLTPEAYAALSEAARAVPRERIAFSPDEHRELVRQLETIA